VLDNWPLLDQAERDAAYNNTAAVADSARLTAERTAASAKLRASRRCVLDVRYGPRERNGIDLFPAADRAAPCLVFIHGGYWQRNSRDMFSAVAEGVLAHGWAAALPGYTLAPDASLREIVAEITAALEWLARDGGAHGIAGPLVISGWSAGGHLTALALAHPRVRAGLAISGIFELGPLRDTYLNEKLRLREDEVMQLSPLRLPAVDKPLAIAYGTRELPMLIYNSRAFHAHRSGAHAPGPPLPIADADHFTIIEELQKPDGQLTAAALALVAHRT
jgi:acetyl esterase/lipase